MPIFLCLKVPLEFFGRAYVMCSSSKSSLRLSKAPLIRGIERLLEKEGCIAMIFLLKLTEGYHICYKNHSNSI